MKERNFRIKVHLLVPVIAIMFVFSSFAHADLIGFEFNTGNLYSVSQSTAALTLIGNTGLANLAGIEFSPTGTLYGFSAGASTLYMINPSTAAATAIGPLGLGVFEGGLTFAPNGTAYGTNASGAANAQLFSINLTTGAATVIGFMGAHDINGLAYRATDNMLIGLDRVTNALVLIDPVTAATSDLAVVPSAIGSVGGMTVAGITGYFNTGGPGGGPGSNQLYSFDLSTGASTLIGNFNSTIVGIGISGLAAAPVATPEPAPFEFVGIGVVVIAAVYRKLSMV